MRHILVRFVREVGFADAVSDGGGWSWGCHSCPRLASLRSCSRRRSSIRACCRAVVIVAETELPMTETKASAGSVGGTVARGVRFGGRVFDRASQPPLIACCRHALCTYCRL